MKVDFHSDYATVIERFCELMETFEDPFNVTEGDIEVIAMYKNGFISKVEMVEYFNR